MIRYLPLGSMLYLLGGWISGFGAGRLATHPDLQSLGCTVVGGLMIVCGYFALRPLLRYAKRQIKAGNNNAIMAGTDVATKDVEAPSNP